MHLQFTLKPRYYKKKLSFSYNANGLGNLSITKLYREAHLTLWWRVRKNTKGTKGEKKRKTNLTNTQPASKTRKSIGVDKQKGRIQFNIYEEEGNIICLEGHTIYSSGSDKWTGPAGVSTLIYWYLYYINHCV